MLKWCLVFISIWFTGFSTWTQMPLYMHLRHSVCQAHGGISYFFYSWFCLDENNNKFFLVKLNRFKGVSNTMLSCKDGSRFWIEMCVLVQASVREERDRDRRVEVQSQWPQRANAGWTHSSSESQIPLQQSRTTAAAIYCSAYKHQRGSQ